MTYFAAFCLSLCQKRSNHLILNDINLMIAKNFAKGCLHKKKENTTYRRFTPIGQYHNLIEKVTNEVNTYIYLIAITHKINAIILHSLGFHLLVVH